MIDLFVAIRQITQFSGRNTDTSAADVTPRGELGLVAVFLILRTAHLIQGATVLVSGYYAYVHPEIGAALLAAALIESGWLAFRMWSTGTGKRVHAVVEVLFDVAGLVAAAYAIAAPDRTTSFNWMLPYSVGGTLLVALAMPLRLGTPVVLLLAFTYLLGATQGLSSPAPGTAPTAIANAVGYLLFYGVGIIVVLLVRYYSRVLDEARHDAIDRSQRLAAETERVNQYRVLHDDALQILEYIASSRSDDLVDIRSQAARAGRRLRHKMHPDAVESDLLIARMKGVGEEFEARGLKVEVVVGPVSTEPVEQVRHALCEATGEALNNVLKHAGSTSAVVYVGESASGIQVTVRDHGRGIQQDGDWRGFGVRHSIEQRLEEVGGTAEVASSPGGGTRVTLWAPT